jgi:hypothetical protein
MPHPKTIKIFAMLVLKIASAFPITQTTHGRPMRAIKYLLTEFMKGGISI